MGALDAGAPLLPAGANEKARREWRQLRERVRCNLRLSGVGAQWSIEATPWSSGRLLEKPSNNATANQNPRLSRALQAPSAQKRKWRTSGWT